MAHHGVDQGGQGLSLQRLQEGLVQVLCGMAMARIKAVMSKGLKKKLYNFMNQNHAKMCEPIEQNLTYSIFLSRGTSLFFDYTYTQL